MNIKTLTALGLLFLVPMLSRTEEATPEVKPAPTPIKASPVWHEPAACCEDLAKWLPYVDYQLAPGNRRVLNDGNLFLPLWQDEDTLIFADIRGQVSDRKNGEGNWGIGARRILDQDIIIGAYGFYDHRWTRNDNDFSQGTFGIEALAVGWEARVNGYLAEGGQKFFGPTNFANPQAVFNGNTIVIQSNSSRSFEEAYSGFDGEVGALIWNGGECDRELRCFLGGYHFDSDNNLPNISGVRGRIEFRMYDLKWLGNGSRLTVGAEALWDDVRDDQYSGFVRLRVAFGGRRTDRKLSQLERRMVDRVRRDVDIVTNTGVQDLGVFTEPGIFVDNDQLIGPVTIVDANTANAPGTIAAAGANSTVIVDGSAGQLATNSTIALQNGQIVRGGGFLVRGAQTGSTATFGTRPTVNNANMAVDTVYVAEGSTLQGIDFIGGLNGVSDNGTELANVTIKDVSVTGADFNGFQFENFNGTLMNSIARNNGNDGFNTLDVNGTITGNQAINSFSNGFTLGDVNGAVTNNTATGSGNNGFDMTDVNGNFSGNTASGSVGTGFAFLNVGTSANFVGNTATGNQSGGFLFFDTNGVFSQNMAIGNTGTGFDFFDINGTVTNNVANGNTGDGFFFGNVNTGGNFSFNAANNNGAMGFNGGVNMGTANGNSGSGNGGGGNTFP